MARVDYDHPTTALPDPTTVTDPRLLSVLLVVTLLTGGCAQLPTSGPSVVAVQQAAARPGTALVQVVNVDDGVARRLRAQRRITLFSEMLGQQRMPAISVGSGDVLEITVWEAPPATLFGAATQLDPRITSSARAATLPEQMVDREGFITVPFVGRVRAGGQAPQAIESEIMRRLRGKANQPEVVVRTLRNGSAAVTVVGDVTNSLRMQLTAGGERLLDALAAAGGVRQPVNKMTLQVTRADQFLSMPLDMVIRDPRQNVLLQPGDVVTASYQPYSFTALGATGNNQEVNFEAQGITLAQALARAGGLQDSRADARGVFIFRFEQEATLEWPRQPVATTPEGKVAVVYQFDLRDPSSFFVMQDFAINDKDVLYVSNAPVSELQKFLNLIFSVAYPVLNTIQLTR